MTQVYSNQVLGPWVRSPWCASGHSPVQCLQWESPSVRVCVCVISTHPHMRAYIWFMFCHVLLGSTKLFCEFVFPSLISPRLLISPLTHLSQQDHPKEQSRALLFKCTLCIFRIINFKKDKCLLA